MSATSRKKRKYSTRLDNGKNKKQKTKNGLNNKIKTKINITNNNNSSSSSSRPKSKYVKSKPKQKSKLAKSKPNKKSKSNKKNVEKKNIYGIIPENFYKTGAFNVDKKLNKLKEIAQDMVNSGYQIFVAIGGKDIKFIGTTFSNPLEIPEVVGILNTPSYKMYNPYDKSPDITPINVKDVKTVFFKPIEQEYNKIIKLSPKELTRRRRSNQDKIKTIYKSFSTNGCEFIFFVNARTKFAVSTRSYSKIISLKEIVQIFSVKPKIVSDIEKNDDDKTDDDVDDEKKIEKKNGKK